MRTTLAIALAAPIALAPFAALAQDTTVEPETAAPEAAMPSLDDAKLQAFVDAIVAIEEVRADYEPQVAAAAEEDRPALIEEANVAMLAAVEETDGITLDEYLAVNEAAAQDPELAQRIVALLPEETQSEDAAPEG